jgi:peptidoglycan/xylan/chitin deacetylase (PgdA/CDA1 family)
VNLTLATGESLSLWVYVAQPMSMSPLPSLEVALSADGFATTFRARRNLLRAGWNQLCFLRSDFVPSGNPTWGSFTAIEVKSPGLSVPVTFALDGLAAGIRTRPKVVIGFDDGSADHYTEAYRIMRPLGLVGTLYLNTALLDRPGRLSQAQGQKMYEFGWDMANHTRTHPDLTRLTKAQAMAELTGTRDDLIARGWIRREAYRHVAYPFGYWNLTVLGAMRDAGMWTGRSTYEGIQANVLDQRWLGYTVMPTSDTWTAARTIARIDRVIEEGGLLELCYHKLVAVPTDPFQISIADFSTVMTYLAIRRDLGQLDVVSKSAWYDGLYNPSLANFQVGSTNLIGGATTTGAVSMTMNVSGLPSVRLTSTSPYLTVPASVAIPSGTRSASFTVRTTRPPADTWVNVYASHVGLTRLQRIRVRR